MESASCFFSATEWSHALVIDPVWYMGQGERERGGGPKCCQFAALIFQPWPVRLEGRRRGTPQSLLRVTALYLRLLPLCLSSRPSRFICARSKISASEWDWAMIQQIHPLRHSLLLMTYLFSSVSPLCTASKIASSWLCVSLCRHMWPMAYSMYNW